ncbi:MAG: hypothetical protein M1G31_05005 [Pseudanabaena sp. Salubria-1]|nr:hypothetical protein [Pseudanabaena sp. Salubria-1]
MVKFIVYSYISSISETLLDRDRPLNTHKSDRLFPHLKQRSPLNTKNLFVYFLHQPTIAPSLELIFNISRLM